MTTVSLCFLLVISALPTFCDNGGVFDKIKEGLRNAKNYLDTVKDIANLVSASLNRKESQRRGDNGQNNEEKEKTKGTFGPVPFVSAFFRLLGLDSQKVTAITVNSVIFLAQMIQNLIKRAQDATLPQQLIDDIDGLDTACVRLLICKTTPVIRAAQISLQTKHSNPFRQITSWLPSLEEFEDNSEVCEQNHTDCLLFTQ
ncbi:uncharacterized protein LOC127287047 isoform X2 [Leptopilina boulardi]|uniref:uncharacterized protein LOC127287047 isoform X2 n=1 Tax=Leptopilina boulardi TaxID=63433 RepID=UPI0021F602DF|nr:uncharacterized protein LOC127287047 isoform X2 [Leptopilina boulardi]